MTDESLFIRLKSERQRMGLKQTGMAALAGVSRETWSRYESGLMAPGMDVLAALAQAGADIPYIVTGLRSDQALTGDERDLLDAFRAAPLAAKAAAMQALLDAPRAGAKQVVHGSVGQSATGDVINRKGVKIEVGETSAPGGRRRR